MYFICKGDIIALLLEKRRISVGPVTKWTAGTKIIDITEEKEMKIVIIGDGKVGYKLAKQLSVENYDVVMIDSNEKKLKNLSR